MANSGLPKLYNSQFKRICPGLCPTCIHLNATAVEDWLVCEKLGKLLSNPHTTPGKCAAYESGEQKLTDAEIQMYHDDALKTQEIKRNRQRLSDIFK